ncbi:hypothetical protein E2C01_024223 [Portunus trituberculatus]|uniref:Uncharacterized protein n=1 Tax=Portunus trituberculatus TaxID=210409 RepID=A0A5B7E9Z8_PORTR|nr:hypothetical protein [Portunus trituberculatus]
MSMGHFLHGHWLCLEACGPSPAAHTLSSIERRDGRTFLLKSLCPQGHSGTHTVTGASLVCAALSATSVLRWTHLVPLSRRLLKRLVWPGLDGDVSGEVFCSRSNWKKQSFETKTKHLRTLSSSQHSLKGHYHGAHLGKEGSFLRHHRGRGGGGIIVGEYGTVVGLGHWTVQESLIDGLRTVAWRRLCHQREGTVSSIISAKTATCYNTDTLTTALHCHTPTH